MSISSMLNIPPRISHPSLSGAEAKEAEHIDLLIIELHGYREEFSTAIDIIDFGYSGFPNGDFSRRMWPLVAARDASMTIYHFGVVLAAIHRLIGLCPTLFPDFDSDLMRQARNEFQDKFPTYARIRHAVAHASELLKNPEKMKRNMGSGKLESPNFNLGDLENAFIGGSLDDHTFIMTREGELLSVDITTETLGHLTEIRDLAYSALRPIEAANAEGR